MDSDDRSRAIWGLFQRNEIWLKCDVKMKGFLILSVITCMAVAS